MKIFVSVKPKARQEKVEKLDDTHYKVSVTEPPVDGRANKAVTGALAEYFGVPKMNIALVSGASSKKKVFDVGGPSRHSFGWEAGRI
ncbi:DUF167 domain-containing protein [bacterium]|nr:MAG: DUF167 domain-containing protein [bacterium]